MYHVILLVFDFQDVSPTLIICIHEMKFFPIRTDIAEQKSF